MTYELSYASNASDTVRHINSVQEWNVKVVGGHVIKLQLAGFRRNGERNTFAMKHLMMPSKKAGVSADAKAERRLMHRVDAAGNKAENPHGGAKAMDPYAQTRGDKYGKAAKVSAAKTKASNSVIDLSLININAVITKIAQACDAANWAEWVEGHVVVDFNASCVRRVQADWAGAGNLFTITHHALATSVPLTGMKVGDRAYEVYHLG
jgi:hypothetical protein